MGIFQNTQTFSLKIKLSLAQEKKDNKVALGSGELRKKHLF